MQKHGRKIIVIGMILVVLLQILISAIVPIKSYAVVSEDNYLLVEGTSGAGNLEIYAEPEDDNGLVAFNPGDKINVIFHLTGNDISNFCVWFNYDKDVFETLTESDCSFLSNWDMIDFDPNDADYRRYLYIC